MELKREYLSENIRGMENKIVMYKTFAQKTGLSWDHGQWKSIADKSTKSSP